MTLKIRRRWLGKGGVIIEVSENQKEWNLGEDWFRKK